MSNRGHLIVAVGLAMFWIPYAWLHDLDPLVVAVVSVLAALYGLLSLRDWMGP